MAVISQLTTKKRKKMKRIQSIFYVVTMISCMLSVASCNSENEMASTNEQEPLQIIVEGVTQTRTIITGKYLPDKCKYGIFVMKSDSKEASLTNGINAQVNYVKGTSTINNNIYVPYQTAATVYAYYPYNEKYNETYYIDGKMTIEAGTQTDYLYGGYQTEEGEKLFVQEGSNPVATIRFKHAMTRVTLKIKKAESNENNYKLPYISLKNVMEGAALNLYEGVVHQGWGNTELMAKPADYVLQNITDEITADFLVIPMNTANQIVTLGMGDNASEYSLTAAIPATNWQAGQQYTYTVTIDTHKMLSISEATITPWINNNQKEIEIGDENYAGIPVNGPIGQAVDLGLSVKWANWNIGASKPEEYGGLYGWADPTGTKISRLNEDYPNSNPPSDICGSIYDIARAQWGKDWRLPSKDEIEELLAQCIWTFTTLNDISGYKVEAENGNSIFLPLTKERSGTNLYDFGRGFYWSGTLDTSMSIGGVSNYAYNIWFSKDGTGCNSSNRYSGKAIRPVTK